MSKSMMGGILSSANMKKMGKSSETPKPAKAMLVLEIAPKKTVKAAKKPTKKGAY